jgi:hypothetical protein
MARADSKWSCLIWSTVPLKAEVPSDCASSHERSEDIELVRSGLRGAGEAEREGPFDPVHGVNERVLMRVEEAVRRGILCNKPFA